MWFFLFLILSVIIFRKINELNRKIYSLENEIKEFSRKDKIPVTEVKKEDISHVIPQETFHPKTELPQSQPFSPEKPAEPVITGKRDGNWLGFERLIGERWLVWVGTLVFAAGFAVFLKQAFERGWIDESARTLFGFIAGFLFIGLSEFLNRKKFSALSQGLAGLGIIIFYLTIFTAYHFYRMLGVEISFALFFLTAIGGMYIAVRRNSFPTAFLSTAGAFATPMMLVDPGSNIYYEPKLFSYLLIVNMGVLYSASLKKWRALSFFSFLFTVYYFLGWYFQEYVSFSDFHVALGFAIVYFLAFSLISVIYSISKKEISKWEDVVLVIANPTVFFLLLRDILNKKAGMAGILPIVPLFMALYHFVLAAVVRKINGKDKFLYFALVGTAIGLLTLPVPMMAKSYWVTAVWGGEALLLIAAGSLLDRKALRTGGLAIFILVLCSFLLYDSEIVHANTPLFFNMKFFAMLLTSFSFCLAGIFLAMLKNITKEEKNYSGGFWALFIGMLFWISNQEIFSYFSDAAVNLEGIKWVLSTILWAVFSFCLILAGTNKKVSVLRLTGLVLVTVTFLKVIADVFFLFPYLYGYPFIFNLRFLSAGAVLSTLVYGAMLYGRDDIPKLQCEKDAAVYLWGLFFILLFIELNVQALSYLENVWNPGEQKLAAALSSLWIVYGFGLLIAGFLKRIQSLRIAALLLFGVTLLKLLFIDMMFVDNLYKIFLLIGTGTVLIVCAYFYRRYRKRLQEREL
ncbi:MAG TPA: DUF2339 domain-containing protein [bacterium]|nr:DUF2339 domain-containing protein [bacterium]